MSDEKSSPVDDIIAEAQARASLAEKSRRVKEHRLNREIKNIEDSERKKKALDSLDVRTISDAHITSMYKEYDTMVDSLKSNLPFVTPSLTDKVSFNYPSLFFIGAKTGVGKSTMAANIAYMVMQNKIDRQNGDSSRGKVLILSNEEIDFNVYNRLACMYAGYNYNKVRSFTKEQHENIKALGRKFAESNKLRVIDNRFEIDGVKGATSTFEGIKSILDNLLEKYRKNLEVNPKASPDYDVIIIDYLQKITDSLEDPGAPMWSVLKRTTDYLDRFYKDYPAPVVVFGQIKPEAKDEVDDDGGFEFRIKHGKDILVAATTALEIKRDFKNNKTEIVVRKSRWGGSGVVVPLGYDRGRYVDFTEEFEKKLMEIERSNNVEKLRTLESSMVGGVVDKVKPDGG